MIAWPRVATTDPGDEASRDGRVLLDVALRFGATLDLDALVQLALERVTALLDAERALFALHGRDGRVERAVLHGLAWEGGHAPLPVSGRLIRDVLAERRPVVISDVEGDLRYGRQASVQLHGIRFMVGVPVQVERDMTGVLYVDSRLGPRQNLHGRVELLEALAALVAMAVRNARLYEEQQFRAQLLAAMAHDFRAPLSAILASAEFLSDGARGGDAAALEEAALDVRGAALRMSRMIDDTLQLSRIDAGVQRSAPASLDLGEAVPAHLRSLDPVARSLGVSLVVDVPEALPPVETVPERLWVILDNLVFNALKNGAPGEPVRVALALREDPGPPETRARRADDTAYLFARVAPLRPAPGAAFVEVSVHNRGSPIAASLLPDVFRAYVRGEAVTRGYAATGLGLSIVDQCARHLGGAVWVRSTAAEGTRFAFSLPTRVLPA